MKKLITILTTFLLLSPGIKADAPPEPTLERRVTRLLKSEVNLDSLKAVVKDINRTSDGRFLCRQIERIIAVTSQDKNSKPYVFSLIAYGQCRTNKTMLRLNEAYRIARANNYTKMAVQVLDTKGIIFKEKGMYDSLLVSLLKAKDIYEEDSHPNELVIILHTTADLYFRVKLYDKARKLYLKIMELKGDRAEWKFWRHVVILNNLGLIEKEKARYGQALIYFKKSYDLIKADSSSSWFGTALGYNALQFSDCYLRMGEDSLALSYYKKSMRYTQKNNMLNELSELYMIKSRLLFNAGKMDSSLVYVEKSFDAFRKKPHSKNQLLAIYKSLYEIHDKLDNYTKANNYLKLYVSLQDSLYRDAQSAREMQILAESDYQKAVKKMNMLKAKNYFLLALTILTTLFLIIVISYYLRLSNANKSLVDKNLEIAHADISLGQKKIAVKDTPGATTNGIEQEELIHDLKHLITKEKLYLQNDISINDIAKKLNSNRTYLSRAINKKLNMNFIAYINDLRIQEAVRGISTGKFKNLTIEGIASEVGFNNRVSFNSAFKKYTGVSPSYFISEVSRKGA